MVKLKKYKLKLKSSFQIATSMFVAVYFSFSQFNTESDRIKWWTNHAPNIVHRAKLHVDIKNACHLQSHFLVGLVWLGCGRKILNIRDQKWFEIEILDFRLCFVYVTQAWAYQIKKYLQTVVYSASFNSRWLIEAFNARSRYFEKCDFQNHLFTKLNKKKSFTIYLNLIKEKNHVVEEVLSNGKHGRNSASQVSNTNPSTRPQESKNLLQLSSLVMTDKN